MSSRRTLKAAEAIREVVSMAILTELRDPRVRNVTVTYVEVAPDMRSAKIHVSIMADEAKTRLTMRGLENAAGFLQQRVSERIDTRYTPRLQFVLDKGVKNSIAISKILSEVLPKDSPTTPPAEGDSADLAEQEVNSSEADVELNADGDSDASSGESTLPDLPTDSLPTHRPPSTLE